LLHPRCDIWRRGSSKIPPRSVKSLPAVFWGPPISGGARTRRLRSDNSGLRIQVFQNSGLARRSLAGLLGVSAMRMNAIAMMVAFPVLVMMGNVTTATAADSKPDVKGLYLLTDYPTVSVRPGTTSTISMRLQNYGLPPENFALSVDGAPAGWTATILGGGQPVGAAMPATDQSVSLQLRVDVPADSDTAS